MPVSLSSLLERLCTAFALELAAGRYQSLSAMLDQAASEQELLKKIHSSKQIQIIAEIGRVRWRAWADRSFQAFFSCHRPVEHRAPHLPFLSTQAGKLSTFDFQKIGLGVRPNVHMKRVCLDNCRALVALRRKNPRGDIDKRIRAPRAWLAPSTQCACFAPNCSNTNHNRFYSFV